MKRKLINPRNIGDKVTIFATVDFIYEDHPGNKVKRVIIRRNLETPLVGVITGGSYKPTGTVVREHYSQDTWMGEGEYESGYLQVDKTHFVYTVKLGLLNTDYYALPDDLLTNLGSHKIPVKYAPNSGWPECCRSIQRENVKEAPRDSRGRWVKEPIPQVK